MSKEGWGPESHFQFWITQVMGFKWTFSLFSFTECLLHLHLGWWDIIGPFCPTQHHNSSPGRGWTVWGTDMASLEGQTCTFLFWRLVGSGEGWLERFCVSGGLLGFLIPLPVWISNWTEMSFGGEWGRTGPKSNHGLCEEEFLSSLWASATRSSREQLQELALSWKRPYEQTWNLSICKSAPLWSSPLWQKKKSVGIHFTLQRLIEYLLCARALGWCYHGKQTTSLMGLRVQWKIKSRKQFINISVMRARLHRAGLSNLDLGRKTCQRKRYLNLNLE